MYSGSMVRKRSAFLVIIPILLLVCIIAYLRLFSLQVFSEDNEENPAIAYKRYEILERKARVKEVCAKWRREGYDKRVKKSRSTSWMKVDEENRLSVCLIPKSGSTTVLKHFLEMNRKISPQRKKVLRNDPNALHTKFGKMFLRIEKDQSHGKSIDKLNAYLNKIKATKFTFVRHPYERFVSAFEDKVVGKMNNNGNFGRLARRLKGNFTNFVNYVLKKGTGCVPFQKCHEMNPHWRPAHARCHFCDMDYDVIGRLDTFSDDLAYVFHLAGIDHSLSFGTKMNSVPHADDRTAKYLATLDTERLKRLHDLFQYDFELFGFDASLY